MVNWNWIPGQLGFNSIVGSVGSVYCDSWHCKSPSFKKLWTVHWVFFNSQCKKKSEMLIKISHRQLVSGVTDFSPNNTDANEID